MHNVLVSFEDSGLQGCDDASRGDILKEHTAFTHPTTQPHIPEDCNPPLRLCSKCPIILKKELTMDW